MTDEKAKKSNWKRILFFVIFGLFSAVFIVSAIYLGDYFLETAETKKSQSTLVDIKEQIQNQLAARPTTPEGTPVTEPGETLPYDPNSPILPEYQAVYALNNDMVGWIKIEGTTIDHPVLYHPEQKDYYL